jgi:hypothetical protein
MRWVDGRIARGQHERHSIARLDGDAVATAGEQRQQCAQVEQRQGLRILFPRFGVTRERFLRDQREDATAMAQCPCQNTDGQQQHHEAGRVSHDVLRSPPSRQVALDIDVASRCIKRIWLNRLISLRSSG